MRRTTEKRAVIGKAVAEIAIKANPDLRKNYARLSNWRQGLTLPSLEDFFDFCINSETTDIAPIVEKITSSHPKST